MTLKNILLLSCFTIFSSCNGQEKTKTSNLQHIPNPGPIVIKNFRTTAPDFDTTLVSQYIRSIFQDSKGNLWFGTIGDGVVRYDEKTLRYFSKPAGFINSSVFAINDDKNGNIWFASANGLNRCIQSMYQDQSGNMWWGAGNGLFRFDGRRFYQVKKKGPWY